MSHNLHGGNRYPGPMRFVVLLAVVTLIYIVVVLPIVTAAFHAVKNSEYDEFISKLAGRLTGSPS